MRWEAYAFNKNIFIENLLVQAYKLKAKVYFSELLYSRRYLNKQNTSYVYKIIIYCIPNLHINSYDTIEKTNKRGCLNYIVIMKVVVTFISLITQ